MGGPLVGAWKDVALLLGGALAVAAATAPLTGAALPPEAGERADSGLVSFRGEGVRLRGAPGELGGAFEARAWRLGFAYRRLGAARFGPPIGVQLQNVHLTWPGVGVEVIADRAVVEQGEEGVELLECVIRRRQGTVLFAERARWRDGRLDLGEYRVDDRRAPRRRGLVVLLR